MKNRSCWYLALIFSFLIGNYKGYIALWTNQNTEPAYISPYSVASLPEEDQKAVNSGIYIENESELRRILEDYLS